MATQRLPSGEVFLALVAVEARLLPILIVLHHWRCINHGNHAHDMLLGLLLPNWLPLYLSGLEQGGQIGDLVSVILERLVLFLEYAQQIELLASAFSLPLLGHLALHFFGLDLFKLIRGVILREAQFGAW